MRMILGPLCAVGLALLVGCASPPQYAFQEVPPASSPEVEAAAPPEPAPVVGAAPADAGATPELIVTPGTSLEGTVVSVNEDGGFAVLKFPVGQLPALESTLIVHRHGMKVGELKVTGPQKDDHIVADIRTGECQVKDVVRDR